MRNALNKLADTVSDPAEKKVSFLLFFAKNCFPVIALKRRAGIHELHQFSVQECPVGRAVTDTIPVL